MSATVVCRLVAFVLVVVGTLFSGLSPLGAVTLQLDPPSSSGNQFDIEISASVGFLSDSDTDTATTSGAIEVDFDYVLNSGNVTLQGITFTGGTVALSDVDFSLSFLFASLNANGTNLAGTASTLSPPGSVTPTSTGGTFPGAEHQFLINQGQITTSGVVTQNFNFATNPISGPGVGSGTIELDEIARTASSVTYNTSVSLPVDFASDFSSNGADVTVEVEGTLIASGEWTVPLPLLGDFNGDGAVDAADYTVWRDNEGAVNEGNLLSGNGNGGPIDQSDYALWASNYGSSQSALAASVPEPAAGLLAGGLLASLAASVRRRL